MIKGNIEKSLKRFLKRKVSYSLSLLIAFMITGGISLGAGITAEEIQETKSDFLTRIQTEREEIKRKIAENERLIKEYNADFVELVRKGDFYSKPLFNSTQIFFTYQYLDNGKMKNRTDKEFAETVDAVNKHYGTKSGRSLLRTTENIGKDKIVTGNGVAVDDTVFREEINLGVNIKLIKPKLPVINKDINISMESPDVKVPSIPNLVVNIPTSPTSGTPLPVNVSTPVSVNKIETTITSPKTPIVPEDKIVIVGSPITPDTFDPTMIVLPEVPSIPVINIPTFPTIEINVISNGNGYEVYVDNPNGNNSVISHVGVLNGDFKIIRKEGSDLTIEYDNFWEYSYSNYDVVNIGSMDATGDISLSRPAGETYQSIYGLTTNGTFKISMEGQRGFMRQLEQYPTYTNGNFVITRMAEDPNIYTDEFIHMDMHGGTNKKNVEERLKIASSMVGKDTETLDAWNDIINNLDNYKSENTYSVFSNSGNIILEGGNLSLNNQYDHYGRGKNVIINTGNIKIQPFSDGSNQYGGINAVFVVSRDLSGAPHDIMYNGSTGKIDVYTKNSVGYIIDSGYNYGPITDIYVYKRDFSNHNWNTWETNPTGGNPQVYDISNSNIYYSSYDDIKSAYSYNPYSSGGSYDPTFSIVNRGEMKIYGAGSAGIYLKNIGTSNGTVYYSKDDRGSLTSTLDLVGVDCSANGGVPDWTKYPEYGFPIVAPAYQETIVHYPTGWPTDSSEIDMGRGTVEIQLVSKDGNPAPITLYGDKSIGLYVPGQAASTVNVNVYEEDVGSGTSTSDTYTTTLNSIGKIKGNVYIDLGDDSGTGNKTYTSDSNETQGIQITNDPLGNSDLTTIDGATGILSGADLSLNTHGIRIFEGNKGSIGIGVINNSTHNLGIGYINILGGDSNVGILIDEGKVVSKGELNILGGTNSVGILQNSGKKGIVDIEDINVGKADNSTKGAVGIFATNLGTELTLKGKINIYGGNFGAFTADSGKIILTKDSLTGTSLNPDMYIKGESGKAEGIGLLSFNKSSGGLIEANNYYLKAEDGGAGVVSIGNGSKIELKGSVVDYSGTGYAVYSDGDGIIDLSDGKIILGGKATATELDLSGSSPVIFNENTRIRVESDDVIVFNLKNATGLDTTDLETTIVNAIGNDLSDLIESVSGIDEYKTAAVDGGSIAIGNLDKSGTGAVGETQAQLDGNFYYNRFLGQRLVATATNSTIKAILNNNQAARFNNQVVGLEMNSSRAALNNSETGIHLVSSTIIADRDDTTGSGAIGAYINFGRVSLDNSSEIKIETEGNYENNGGVGIYAVNGSKIANLGKITVAGEQGIGIFGMAYREDIAGNIKENEFGGKAEEGTLEINNFNEIYLNGIGSIGIYGINNNKSASNNEFKLNNLGSITVGNSTSLATTVGIYGEKAIISNTGSITTGNEGIGIYAQNNSEISDLGVINLGGDAIGVVADGTSTISATTVTLNNVGTDNLGKIGLFYKGTGNEVQSINIAIDAQNFSKGIAIYSENMNLVSNGNIKVGESGVGLYLKGSSINTVTNNGIIDLEIGKADAIGIYSTSGNIINANKINLTDSSQLGIFISGVGNTVKNTGTIDLNVKGSTGIYVKDGATAEIIGNNIVFNQDLSVGTFSEKAQVKITNDITYDENNEKKNIFIYGKDGSEISLVAGKTFTVDGVSQPNTQGNKSVGIYLENTIASNNYLGKGEILVKNEAIGIYSKGENNLDVKVTAEGAKTTGIFVDGKSSIAGIVTATGNSSEGAVGIYATGGKLTVESTGLILNTTTGIGTGMYLTDGAYASGAGVTFNNTSSEKNIGLYYSKGNSTNTVVNDVQINLMNSESIAIYAADGINLTNNKKIITGVSNSGSIGVYISDNSNYISNADIVMNDVEGIGIYVEDGTAINSVEKVITLTDLGTLAVGMVAEATTGKTALVRNEGTIETGSNIGMYIAGLGANSGKNFGTINVTTGTGVFVKDSGNKFDGISGTINVNDQGTGILLDGTGTGQVTNAGVIALKTENSIGIYAKNSAFVDFPVTIKGTQGIGVYAESGSVISGTIDASNSENTITVYLEDGNTILNGAKINTGKTSLGSTSTSLGLFLGGTGETYSIINTIISVSGADTVGIYTENGNTINYNAETNVGDGAIGIYLKDSGTTLNANAGSINITNSGIGVYAGTGTVVNVGTTGTLEVNFKGDGGILTFNDGGTVNLGANINMATGTGTLAAAKNGSLSNSGTITIDNGSAGLLGVYTVGGPYVIENTLSGIINVKGGGLGLAATGTGATVTVENKGTIRTEGTNTVGIYTDIGTIKNTGSIDVFNGGVGMYSGFGNISDIGTVNVTKGVGYFIDGAISGVASGTVTLNTGDKDNYSIGGYYLNSTGVITLPTMIQNNYSILTAITNGNNSITSEISVKNGNNKLGVFTKNSVTAVDKVSVSGSGNIGVYAQNSNLTTGSISIKESLYSEDKQLSSIGIAIDKGSYKGTGDITIGDNSIGVYAYGLVPGGSVTYTDGSLTTGKNTLGFYAGGTGLEKIDVNMNNMNIGENSSIGIYGQGTNISVTGNMTVGEGNSLGIISTGKGNIEYTGDMTVGKESVGIYKLNANSGNTITTNGNWKIGESAYGIYVQENSTSRAINSITVNNTANMSLGTSAIGIFSDGKNIIKNSGYITVGETNINGSHTELDNHKNSIGIYLSGGSVGENTSSGIITTAYDHSVGVYVSGTGTTFINNGTMNIDAGGVGILVQNNGTAENKGTINIGSTLASCEADSIGMAAYNGGSIVNSGIININEGIGMYVSAGASLINKGSMSILNGTGISGGGYVINNGNIEITPGGNGIVESTSSVANIGSVTIDNKGNILINDKYVSIGGSLSTVGNVIVNGAYVDVTTNTPLFNANSVNGEVRLLPNFALTGNGISYEIEGFVNTAAGAVTGNKLTAVTSPLFVAKVTSTGSLVIAKRPYADLTIGEQFDTMDKGLDNILKNSNGKGKDADILKGLNAYLEGLDSNNFAGETSRKLAEFRGDIYATIQGRMQDINRAFDNSFYELESSYNLTKDSSKYSVIYTDGNYKDSTIGIDDYDYKIMGLLYMKEKEGTEYGNKYGYTLGFVGSKFDFDDGGSKEDVYSLRVGAHRVKNLSEEHKVSWLSRIELGYNRHIAKRKLNLQETFENKGEYNTYSVALDNRITKIIYTDFSRQLDVYADLDLEYGKIDDFKESAGSKGGLEVQIKDNDYLSIQAGAGVKASQRIYAGNDISVKVTADVKYAYEFGDNYDGNKARLKNGGEGYYSLITPEEREGKLSGKVGLTIEKANHMGVTFEVEAADESHKKDSSIKYGVRFNYKF